LGGSAAAAAAGYQHPIDEGLPAKAYICGTATAACAIVI
jgi:hypothetical protein